jgi:HSP20 family protein
MSRFDPFRDMERLMSETLRSPAASAMPMDLYRADDSFVAKIDLPGVDPGSIDVDVEERTLTIRAERREREDVDQWLSHERPSGTFARQLTLGYGVALDRIEAGYEDGVLTLTIPVAEEAKPRKIQVSHTSGEGKRLGGGEDLHGTVTSRSDHAEDHAEHRAS